MKKALILGGTTTALAFARSLGAKGVQVTVTAPSRAFWAMQSKWADTVITPNPALHPAEFHDRLVAWGKGQAERCVLIPTLEEYLPIISAQRKEIEELFLFQIPSDHLITQLIDKQSQYLLLTRAGLTVPMTVYSDIEDFTGAASDKIGFPCILKPCQSHIWRQVPGRFKARVVESRRELESLWQDISSLGLKFLAQEVIPGGDECLHSYLACYNAQGLPLAEITTQKLRQNPVLYGTGCRLISTDNPDLSAISRSALQKIGYAGHVDIEYKWDAGDRSWKLIEINIRGTSFVQLAITSGADLPWVGYLDAGYGKQASPSLPRSGILFMHMGWDLQSVLTGADKPFSSFVEWILLIRKVKAFAVFNLRDLRPIIWEIFNYVKKFPGWFKTGRKKNASFL